MILLWGDSDTYRYCKTVLFSCKMCLNAGVDNRMKHLKMVTVFS